MAHYALLNYNNVVTEVVTGKDETAQDYNIELVYQDMHKQVCKRTSYNTRKGVHIEGGTAFRKNFARPGYIYDQAKDAFIPPQPYDSWTLDESTCNWVPPIAMPTDTNYDWDEDNQQWVQIT